MRHLGWTMILIPGYLALAAAVCSPEKRAWPEQLPFLRISFADCSASGVFPQREERIPDDHLLGRDLLLHSRVETQVLVREEEVLFALREGPLEDVPGKQFPRRPHGDSRPRLS